MAKKRAVRKKAAEKPVQAEHEASDPVAVVESVLSAFPVSGTKFPPIYKRDGQFNPDYLTAAYACLVGSVTEAVMIGEKPPTSLSDGIKALQTIAAIHGYELERVTDKRTPEQIIYETALRLADAPETILEQTEQMLEQIEKAMLRSVAMTDDQIKERVSTAKAAMDLEYLRDGPQRGTTQPA